MRERVSVSKYRVRRALMYFSGDDEGNGLDRGRGDLVSTRDLAVGDGEAAAGKEAHAALRVGRLVLCEREQVVVLVLVVADVPVTAKPRRVSVVRAARWGGTHPLPARKRMLLSVQNGMSTPEVWSIVRVLTLASEPVSQIAA